MSDAHRDEIAKLETLYAEHPEGRIFTHLAEAYRKAGDLERAREVLTDGIGRHPDYSSAHVVLGRVLMDLGQNEEAEAEFRRVLELDRHNLVALRSLGDVARAEGREEDAIEHYTQLLDLEPSDDDVRDIIESMTSDLVVPGSQDDTDAAAAADVDEPGEVVAEEPGAEDPDAGLDAEEAAEWEPAAEAETAGFDVGELEAVEPEPVESEPWATADPGSEEAGIGEPEREEIEGPEDVESAEGEDVMTETIAQVYARQGLYDRAAEVYRELVRARPEHEGLRERLAEMESKAAESDTEAAPEFGPVADSEAAPEAAPAAGGLEGLEPDEAGLEPAGWSLDEVTPEETEPIGLEADEEPAQAEGFYAAEFDGADVEPEPLPGLETEEMDPDSGLSVGAADTGDDEVDEAPDEAADEAADEEWALDAEESVVEAEAPEVEDAPGALDEPDWLEELVAEDDAGTGEPAAEEDVAEEEAVDDGAVGDYAPEEPASPWTAEDWSESEEEAETPYAWAAEEEAAADTSPPIGAYLSGLLEWAGDGDVTGSAAGGAEPGGPAAAGPGPGGPESGEDDDDLEMFRSWLESLKQ